MNNAARCLHAFGASEDVKIFPGAPKPLIRHLRHDPEIHGADGLGGVEGLPSIAHPEVVARIQNGGQKPSHAIHGLAEAIRDTWRDGEGHHVTVVATGPLTNIALFVSVYPDLVNGVGKIDLTACTFAPALTRTWRQTRSFSWVEGLVWATALLLQVSYLLSLRSYYTLNT